MAKTDRKTLKEYFSKGKKPDSSQFADLIDSMLNILDDGFSRLPERGVLLSPLNSQGPVMEVRKRIQDDDPQWVLSLGADMQLHIYRKEEEEAFLTLYQDGRIVLGENGKANLTVNGTVQADSFTGAYLTGHTPADGKWHLIGNQEYTCRVYRIVAACGVKNRGKYGIAYVTAMHCFGAHRRIYSRRTWFGERFNKIQFRWKREGNLCGLEVRTRRNYGEGVMIHYQVTSLLDMDFVTHNTKPEI